MINFLIPDEKLSENDHFSLDHTYINTEKS